VVSTTDVKFYKVHLGGAFSTSTEVQTGAENNLFGNVPGNDVVTGKDYYDCIYIYNSNQTEDMKLLSFWLTSQSGFPYADTLTKWAKDAAGLNGTAQTIADANTAPTSVVWNTLSATEPSTVNIGTLKPGEYYPLWIWRHVNANAAARKNDGPLFAFSFDIPSSGSGSGGGGGGLDLDIFGIAKMFKTKTGGREWFSTLWANGHPRTLATNTFDPDDANLGYHIGNPSPTRTFVINGDGTATMPETMGPTDTQRIFINGPWLNTEITVYARFRTTSWQSFQLRSRSNHHGTQSLPYGYDSSNDISCGFGNYLSKWSEAGDTKTSTEVEVIHDLYKRHLDEHDFTLPLINVWTGYKQITRTIGNTVNVQGWINYSLDHQNAWTKTTEFTFDGTNVTIDPTGHELNVTNCLNAGDKISGSLNANTLWLNPGKWSWIRINGGDDVDLQFFSVREIEGGSSTGGGGSGGNPPPAPTNWKMAIIGDEGCTSTTDKVVNMCKNYDYTLSVGDHAYSSASCWTGRFGVLKPKFNSAYGNHEYSESGGIAPYKSFFGHDKTYFSFDFQNVHIVVVDTNISISSGSAQYTFVKADLEAQANRSNIDWIIVDMHHPWWVPGGHHPSNQFNQVQTFLALFTQNKVSFVVTGHNHNWQRTHQVSDSGSPNSPTIVDNTSPYVNGSGGLIHVVTGAAGHDVGPRKLYSLGSQPSYQAFQDKTHNGIWEIIASNNGKTLTCSFVDVSGAKFDTFTITTT
jgi:hypothetical protein